MLRVLDLFSGIGGFSLGLERTGGFETVAFCEIEPFCQKVLAKHWPDVPIFEDVRTIDASGLGRIDCITGGYPCQGESVAGQRSGVEHDAWLWPEMYRLVNELRPAWVIGENTAGHTSLSLDTVLDDLEASNYAARAFDIPAGAAGSPQYRHRVWVVAHANEKRRRPETQKPIQPRRTASELCSWWSVEPNVDRVAYGVPNQLDRGRGLGNTVVNQVPEIIGEAILQAEEEMRAA